ncbi:uncharacterized protein SPPG_06770 [Spizellomyces punctatus DAOM BR117]|uniref:Uncharacterized protein n=1 Tax=Spizellomyces punctatus (strain DAOM BR117) TaxID=645134 RepID=A0A0L0H997_SPIPD|nr:uncharacterized protein SPPG_06770 [Spizellomyces punctatus DAOM BR117]KNC97772.1 hypothetical protein SPPG_06770 [Spizellomyces punctatus DAOM BR117]|eukprot:XP_016605812.1 hypothetical protein SPPG_06770 [Spizellomyces punctatus DAOM BR117]
MSAITWSAKRTPITYRAHTAGKSKFRQRLENEMRRLKGGLQLEPPVVYTSAHEQKPYQLRKEPENARSRRHSPEYEGGSIRGSMPSKCSHDGKPKAHHTVDSSVSVVVTHFGPQDVVLSKNDTFQAPRKRRLRRRKDRKPSPKTDDDDSGAMDRHLSVDARGMKTTTVFEFLGSAFGSPNQKRRANKTKVAPTPPRRYKRMSDEAYVDELNPLVTKVDSRKRLKFVKSDGDDEGDSVSPCRMYIREGRSPNKIVYKAHKSKTTTEMGLTTKMESLAGTTRNFSSLANSATACQRLQTREAALTDVAQDSDILQRSSFADKIEINDRSTNGLILQDESVVIGSDIKPSMQDRAVQDRTATSSHSSPPRKKKVLNFTASTILRSLEHEPDRGPANISSSDTHRISRMKKMTDSCPSKGNYDIGNVRRNRSGISASDRQSQQTTAENNLEKPEDSVTFFSSAELTDLSQLPCTSVTSGEDEDSPVNLDSLWQQHDDHDADRVPRSRIRESRRKAEWMETISSGGESASNGSDRCIQADAEHARELLPGDCRENRVPSPIMERGSYPSPPPAQNQLATFRDSDVMEDIGSVTKLMDSQVVPLSTQKQNPWVTPKRTGVSLEDKDPKTPRPLLDIIQNQKPTWDRAISTATRKKRQLVITESPVPHPSPCKRTPSAWDDDDVWNFGYSTDAEGRKSKTRVESNIPGEGMQSLKIPIERENLTLEYHPVSLRPLEGERLINKNNGYHVLGFSDDGVPLRRTLHAVKTDRALDDLFDRVW